MAIIFQNNPINVSLHDPIVNLDLVSANGVSAKAENLLDTGFLIFLSTDCNECLKAISVYEKYINKQYDSLILLNESSRKDANKYFSKHMEKIFFVKPEDLDRLNIKVLPALLGYQQSKLKIAFHGPLTEENLLMMINHFER